MVALEEDLYTLVVCPAYLKLNWRRELEKVAGKDNVLFTVISYGELAKTAFKYEMVIFDESHYLKNPQSKRTQHAHRLIFNTRPKRVMLLSGTPIRNRVGEFYSLLKLCSYGGKYKFPYSYYSFLMKFTNKKVVWFGNRKVTQYEGMRNISELKELIKPIYFRKRASEVLDLPSINRQYIEGDNGGEFDTELDKVYELLNEGKVPDHNSTIKKANAMAKVPITVKYALDVMSQGEQIVIFTDHIDSCDRLTVELKKKFKVGAIKGSVTPGTRDDLVTKFSNKELDALVCTVGAGSTGFNLVSCNRMLWNDMPYVPSDVAQAEKRIHRIGQTRPCFYYYTILSQVDKKIYQLLLNKIEVLKEIL